MTDDKNNNLTDHDYDGIKELNNQLPDWWLTVLLITIGWAGFYWLHYTIAGGETQLEEYNRKMAIVQIAQKKESQLADSKFKSKSIEELLNSPENIASGKSLFLVNCSSCHGKEGQGSIGPNLTDNFWLHGTGKIKGITQVINKGVLEKGMPPWDKVLSKTKITDIAIYINSIIGSTPEKPKAPQGKEYQN